VETDGRHAKPGGKETEGEDNVVRLPRDWLGPREELIPFGPSTEAEDDGLATPPSTHDFWGEPGTGLWEPDSDGAEPRQRRALRGPRGSEMLSRSLAGVSEHRRAAGIASLIAAGVLALVLALGSSGRHHQLSAAASRSTPTSTALAGLTLGSVLPSLASRDRHPAGHRSSPGAHRRVKTAVKRHTVHRGSRHVTGAATVQSARYAQPAASSSAAQPATSSAQSTPLASTSGSAQTAAASSSGSTNQPALGAAGALAPGSSPDS
jgi:hypothetical protein